MTTRISSPAVPCIIVLLLAILVPPVAAVPPDGGLQVESDSDAASILLIWQAPASGRVSYDVYRDGVWFGDAQGTRFADADGQGMLYTVVATTPSGLFASHATASETCSYATIFFDPDEAPFVSVAVNEECLEGRWVAGSGLISGSAPMGTWSRLGSA